MREYPLSHRDSTVLAIVVFICDTRTVKEGFKECICFVYISLVFPPFYGFAAEDRGRRCTFFLLERPSWFCNVLSLTISQFI